MPDPSDERRLREVNSEIAQLCKGTDNSLAKLKKKYTGNRAVLQRLDEFEAEVEPGSTKRSVK
jgi:hypothetical protein